MTRGIDRLRDTEFDDDLREFAVLPNRWAQVPLDAGERHAITLEDLPKTNDPWNGAKRCKVLFYERDKTSTSTPPQYVATGFKEYATQRSPSDYGPIASYCRVKRLDEEWIFTYFERRDGGSDTGRCGCCNGTDCVPAEQATVVDCLGCPNGATRIRYGDVGTWVKYPQISGTVVWYHKTGTCDWFSRRYRFTDTDGCCAYYRFQNHCDGDDSFVQFVWAGGCDPLDLKAGGSHLMKWTADPNHSCRCCSSYKMITPELAPSPAGLNYHLCICGRDDFLSSTFGGEGCEGCGCTLCGAGPTAMGGAWCINIPEMDFTAPNLVTTAAAVQTLTDGEGSCAWTTHTPPFLTGGGSVPGATQWSSAIWINTDPSATPLTPAIILELTRLLVTGSGPSLVKAFYGIEIDPSAGCPATFDPGTLFTLELLQVDSGTGWADTIDIAVATRNPAGGFWVCDDVEWPPECVDCEDCADPDEECNWTNGCVWKGVTQYGGGLAWTSFGNDCEHCGPNPCPHSPAIFGVFPTDTTTPYFMPCEES